MLSTEAAGLIIMAAKGAIKLSQRTDLLLAEKEAVEAPLALPVPPVGLAPTQPQMQSALRQLLQETEGRDPDPLGADRPAIQHAVNVNPDNTVLFGFMEAYLPEQALGRVLDLDGTFVTALRKARPDWAADPDITVAAFYVGAGQDERNKSYVWRLALTVVDTVAEFGADNASLFSRDEGIQSVVGAVLERFGDADVQTTDSAGALVKTALAATLNGVLDAKADLRVDDPWLWAVFDALVNARAALPEGEQDDFIVGLMRGKGYPKLVGAVVEKAAGLVGENETAGLERIAAAFLTEVAGIIKQKPIFEGFFNDHWGDLLRGGLLSVEEHGPALLEGASPLLREVLVSVATSLSRRPDNTLLSTDALVGIVDTAIAVVAANPDQVDHLTGAEWLDTFISSVSSTITDGGIRTTFTQASIEKMVTDTLATFAAHPELVVDEPGLGRDLLGGILTALGGVDTFSAEKLASAALSSACTVMADHPEVLTFKYADVVATLAGKVGALVRDKQLTKVQGAEILEALTETLAENPVLFLDVEKRLAGFVLDAVTRAAHAGGGLLSGTALVRTLQKVGKAVAATGNAALTRHPAADLPAQLEKLLKAGLARAREELGNQMSLSTLPTVLALLVRAWSEGEIASLDPNNDDFRRLFAELIGQAAAH